jgi:hypothetical protein
MHHVLIQIIFVTLCNQVLLGMHHIHTQSSHCSILACIICASHGQQRALLVNCQFISQFAVSSGHFFSVATLLRQLLRFTHQPPPPPTTTTTFLTTHSLTHPPTHVFTHPIHAPHLAHLTPYLPTAIKNSWQSLSVHEGALSEMRIVGLQRAVARLSPAFRHAEACMRLCVTHRPSIPVLKQSNNDTRVWTFVCSALP